MTRNVELSVGVQLNPWFWEWWPRVITYRHNGDWQFKWLAVYVSRTTDFLRG